MRQILFLALLLATNKLNAQTVLPANMYADSVCAPFYFGVASGDPSSESIVIWTHISTYPDSTIVVSWELAADSSFNTVLKSGTTLTDSNLQHTVKVNIDSLNPAQTYYYRFSDNSGNYSTRGRAKTLPNSFTDNTKIAVMSCSSIYSGFFNAYRRIAEREDLQMVIHLGDYIYDYADADEQIRIPVPAAINPSNKAEFIERHKYYLLDPDLRAARAMQSWLVYWDNHDLDRDSVYAKEVFRRWLPIKETPEVQNNKLFRNLSIGDLADVYMLDVQTMRNLDTFENGESIMTGREQFDWITDEIKNSNAVWKLIGSQKMVGGWYTRGINQSYLNLVPNDGAVFDNGSWDGFMETRNRLFDTISTHNINNLMFLSGDAHITMMMDFVKDPFDSINYDKVSGNGAVGTEFLPSSITRGNFDESGVPTYLSSFFINTSKSANPHHQHMEINSHGYGLLEINRDSIIATPFYSDILNISNIDNAGRSMVMINGENHWKRSTNTAVETLDYIDNFKLYPNPSTEYFKIKCDIQNAEEVYCSIFDYTGKLIKPFKFTDSNISTEDLANGLYFLKIEKENKLLSVLKLVICR
jgi:alkaline phosphatase D